MATSPKTEDTGNEEEHQQQEKSKIYSVWDFFDKQCNTRAKCQLCGNTYNYASSSANLKTHLARVHIDSFPNWAELHDVYLQRLSRETKRPQVSRGRSVVWKYFEKIDGTQEAECSFCRKQISYRSTSHNLKTHLLHRHPEAELEEQKDVIYEDVQYLEIASEDESSLDTPAESPTDASVWRYFETEGDGLSRCSLCEAITKVTKQRQHLTKRHPKVLATLLMQQASEDEDEKPNPKNRTRAFQPETIEYVGTRKRKRKPANNDTSDEETHVKKTSKTSPEKVPDQKQDLPVFLQYLGSLLKDMPQEVCLQLQMDIVNRVMKARLDLEKVKRNSSELTTNGAKQHPKSAWNDMASKSDSDDILQRAVDSQLGVLPSLDDGTDLEAKS